MRQIKRVSVILAFLCAFALNAQTPKAKPPFTFAVMTDVQYADKDTWKGRHYRDSLKRLDECVADLNQKKPAFTAQLGDIIDGYPGDIDRSAQDLDKVLEVYNRLAMPHYHVIGNHCVMANRDSLLEKYGLKKSYYDFTVPGAKGWRFVVLDGVHAGNGVLGKDQISWLCALLKQAEAKREKVICFCHFAPNRQLLKDIDEVLRTAADTGCIAAWFSGHVHGGGYVFADGIHQVTVRGMVEASAQNAYALVEIHPGRLKETGIGEEPSRNLPFGRPAE
ncbi:MAG: metallophosphoesterase [Kiritimatiellales bacterium]|jgi:hypothetical protein